MYLSKKKIKGKEYLYLVHSVRMKDGRIKKIAKMLKSDESKNLDYLKKKYKGFFEDKIRGIQLEESKKVDVRKIVKKVKGKKKVAKEKRKVGKKKIIERRKPKKKVQKIKKKIVEKKRVERKAVKGKIEKTEGGGETKFDEIMLLRVLEDEVDWANPVKGMNLFLKK